MKKTLINNASIFDGTGSKPFVGSLLIEGNRIKSVTKGKAKAAMAVDSSIDGSGIVPDARHD